MRKAHTSGRGLCSELCASISRPSKRATPKRPQRCSPPAAGSNRPFSGRIPVRDYVAKVAAASSAHHTHVHDVLVSAEGHMRAVAYYLYDWRLKDGSKVVVRMRGRVQFRSSTPDRSPPSCWSTTRIWCETPWRTNTPEGAGLRVRDCGFRAPRRLGRASAGRARRGAGLAAEFAAQLRRGAGRDGAEPGLDGGEIRLGPGTCASSASRMARKCAGVVPQQPPMIRAPASQRQARIFGHQFRRAVEADLARRRIAECRSSPWRRERPWDPRPWRD